MAPWSRPNVNTAVVNPTSGQQNTPTSAGPAPAAANINPKDGIVPILKRSTDPNIGDSRLLVHRRCIYERNLPGGAYITAHIERLQHGYIGSPSLTGEEVDNVDFVSINFNFHPSHAQHHRFKTAIIKLSVHNSSDEILEKELMEEEKGRFRIFPSRRSSFAVRQMQENGKDGSGLSRQPSQQTPPRRIRHHHVPNPRFIAYAPHLIYGAVSPETLQWTFSLAGTLGVSETPVSASMTPYGSMRGQYQLFEMLKIQGSSRTLISPLGPDYDVNDGEIVWSLEENSLQRSGLPREFSFPFLVAKPHWDSNVRLHLEIEPVIDTWFGVYPSWWVNLGGYQPFPKPPTTLRHEIGQKFKPVDKDRGLFNFAKLAGSFDSYVNMPGSTYNSNLSPDGVPLDQGSSKKMNPPENGPGDPGKPPTTTTGPLPANPLDKPLPADTWYTSTAPTSSQQNTSNANTNLTPTKQVNPSQLVNGTNNYEQYYSTRNSTARLRNQQYRKDNNYNDENNEQTLNVRITLDHNLSSAAATAAAAAAAMFYNHPNYALNNQNINDPHSGMRSPSKRPTSPFLMAAAATAAASFQQARGQMHSPSHTHPEQAYSPSYQYQPRNRDYPAGRAPAPTTNLHNVTTLNDPKSTTPPKRTHSLRRTRSREDLSSVQSSSGSKQQKYRTPSTGAAAGASGGGSVDGYGSPNPNRATNDETSGRIISEEEDDVVEPRINNTRIRSRPQSEYLPQSQPQSRSTSGQNFQHRYSYIEGEEDELDYEGDTLAVVRSPAGSARSTGSGSPLTADIANNNHVNGGATASPTMRSVNGRKPAGAGLVTGNGVPRAESLSVASGPGAATSGSGGRLLGSGTRAVSNNALGDIDSDVVKRRNTNRDREKKRYSYHFEGVDQF